ncbi:cytochrome C biogenesis protein [bacterium BMS3Abin10]|nr:cytochrome C biogenesis protein [bacterium BMS3Abin10]
MLTNGTELNMKNKVDQKGMSGKIFFLIFLFLFSGSNASYGREVSRMELEKVTDLIMSPGCNYVYTLTNCPSGQAEQMRELVKDRIKKGESTEEILSYFEDVYGLKILAQPSKKGFYFIAWWFPYFLILDVFVLAGIFLFLWRKKSGNKDTPLNDINPEIETLLEDEVRKFRENE